MNGLIDIPKGFGFKPCGQPIYLIWRQTIHTNPDFLVTTILSRNCQRHWTMRNNQCTLVLASWIFFLWTCSCSKDWFSWIEAMKSKVDSLGRAMSGLTTSQPSKISRDYVGIPKFDVPPMRRPCERGSMKNWPAWNFPKIGNGPIVFNICDMFSNVKELWTINTQQKPKILINCCSCSIFPGFSVKISGQLIIIH